MPAAYDLNHSKYTVQKIANEWEKMNNNAKLKKVRNNEKQKKKKIKANKHIVHASQFVAVMGDKRDQTAETTCRHLQIRTHGHNANNT